ncbi:MAG: hypothetical protein AAFT19_02845 [Pseudomonadota bacterium]
MAWRIGTTSARLEEAGSEGADRDGAAALEPEVLADLSAVTGT